ncbi:hypothetical protein ACI65C_013035 [Semiaphis heraclei]
MNHTSNENKPSWVPPTGGIGPQEPAVGSGARPDGRYHHAPGYAQMKTDRTNGLLDMDVLRLRGGGNSEPGADSSNDRSGDMVVDQPVEQTELAAASGSNQVPPSSGGQGVLKKKAIEPSVVAKSVNQHLGWLEHMATAERAKKLTVSASEGMLEHLQSLRDIYTELCIEVARLGCKAQVTQDQLHEILNTFGKSLSGKTAEIDRLKKENAELRAAASERPKNAEKPTEDNKSANKSYAQTAASTPFKGKQINAPKKKSEVLKKCRDAKVATRFVIDIPTGMTVSQRNHSQGNGLGKISGERRPC